ncbi:NYN domain-containing protein [Gordonia sp. FQ]|uniref:NYN domain-containing protein n=1 Tax=Gordonia sp. FQ TaxID=3446634 RepID=UPI003F871AEC
MKVGVYVDAFNLYYGMRNHCGRSTPGWRWLDVRGLASELCGWDGAEISRVVYCTAKVDAKDDYGAHSDQNVYLRALRAHGSIDVLELGRYVAWPKIAPLAKEANSGRAEIIRPGGHTLPPGLPIWQKEDGTMYLARVRMREEKGSDVNVAAHLLADVLSGEVNAAIVISNDSDLALPLRIVRALVPLGTVNPGTKQLAGALRGSASEGPGRHWWAKLSPGHYYRNQMPETVGRWHKPPDW